MGVCGFYGGRIEIMIENTCKICNRKFFRPKNPNKVFKYCSTKCMGKDKDKNKKHSEYMIGRTPWNKGMKGMQSWHDISGFKPGWNKGMTGIHSEEALESNRIKHLGKEPVNKGKKMSEEQRALLSIIHTGRTGKLSNAWRGGLADENQLIRGSLENKEWRKSVFRRDNYTCQRTGKKGVYLEAHHIDNFCSNKELRFNTDNGITLCKKEHREFHRRYGKKNNNINQLNEFMDSKWTCEATGSRS